MKNKPFRWFFHFPYKSSHLMKSIWSLALLVCLPALATVPDIGGKQGEYEREIGAIVRNKRFYKAGKLEFSGGVGLMPYDSVYSNLSFGGRGTWHFGDHYGWEILDVQMVTGSTSGFTTSLVSGAGGAGQLVDLQAVQSKMFIGSNFLLSPIYGKIRFFGAQVVYFDIYTVAGLGVAKTETHKFSGSGGTVSDTIVNSGMDPMATFGLGFKIFFGSGLGILVDLRDYVSLSTAYGSKSAHNAFVVNFGLAFFLPGFG